MATNNTASRVANRLLTAVLRSPLHAFASDRFALVIVTGRRTGRIYTVPVNYIQQGHIVTIVSRRNRTWWRNLSGGAPVKLRLRGRDVGGQAVVVADDQGVAAALGDVVATYKRPPKKYRNIAEAATRVVIRVTLRTPQYVKPTAEEIPERAI